MSPIKGSGPSLPYSPPASSSGASGNSAAKQSVIPAAAPPSSTVTLSDQARSATDHPAVFESSYIAPAASFTAPATTPDTANSSTYESMKRGIASAIGDVEDVAGEGVHAVVSGVETVVSSANALVRGVLESPFVVVGKICDTAGAVIDKI